MTLPMAPDSAVVPPHTRLPPAPPLLPKKCLYCDRRFAKTEHLNRHQRSHTGERPFKCPFCSKRYSRSDVLGRHIRGHAPNADQDIEPATEADDASYGSDDRDRDGDRETGRRHSSTTVPDVAVINPCNPASTWSNLSPPLLSQKEHLMTDAIPDLAGTASVQLRLDDKTPHSRSGPPLPSPSKLLDPDSPFTHSLVHLNDKSAFPPTAPFYTSADLLNLSCDSSTLMPVVNDINHDHAGALPNNTFQFSWLEYNDGGPLSLPQDPSGPFELASANTVARLDAASPESMDSRSPKSVSDDIPTELFVKVKQCWPTKPNHTTSRLILDLWHDLIYLSEGNLLSDKDNSSTALAVEFQDNPQSGSRWGVDEQCRERLKNLFGHVCHPPQLMLSSHHDHQGATNGNAAPGFVFPSVEVLDIGLDLYFRHFHPLMPFVHVATFDAKSMRPSTLFIMCLIGFTILNSQVAIAFVQHAFPAALKTSLDEINPLSCGEGSSSYLMGTFSTAFLMMSLSQITGNPEHQRQCQVLYLTVMSIAQQHGLFTVNDSQPLTDIMLDRTLTPEKRWFAWARVESAKRLIICLIMEDAWYSGVLHASPILNTDDVQVLLPCDATLFSARSVSEWSRLVANERSHPILMPTLTMATYRVPLPHLPENIDPLGMHGILSLLRLRISISQHRLFSSRRKSLGAPFVPWHTFATDQRAALAATSAVEAFASYGPTLRNMNSNCLVLWHNLCIMLCADLGIFEVAAGRDGEQAAREALDKIAIWARTMAARRACLHTAESFRVIANRRSSDGIMFHCASSLFASALVLGLYIFLAPPQESDCLELLDEVDWKRIGALGLNHEAVGSDENDDPAMRFIRHGGSVSFSGVVHLRGLQAARRVLLDYAGLLEDVGKWKIAPFSRVLRIMSNALVDR
ncbi:uncharacterized protein V1518DRAFT_423793 [Limtongia smithiae]|uniref:uncharacterized protein n=1 Tax=Limtongia smithiae TaxID=1125753 RepID=UPI0034CDB669